MAELKQRITDAMKDAMRAKEKARLGAIRLILAELKRIEVDERIDLDDTRVLAVLDKMLKQRRDSISQFEAADRQDLADVRSVLKSKSSRNSCPRHLAKTKLPKSSMPQLPALALHQCREWAR